MSLAHLTILRSSCFVRSLWFPGRPVFARTARKFPRGPNHALGFETRCSTRRALHSAARADSSIVRAFFPGRRVHLLGLSAFFSTVRAVFSSVRANNSATRAFFPARRVNLLGMPTFFLGPPSSFLHRSRKLLGRPSFFLGRPDFLLDASSGQGLSRDWQGSCISAYRPLDRVALPDQLLLRRQPLGTALEALPATSWSAALDKTPGPVGNVRRWRQAGRTGGGARESRKGGTADRIRHRSPNVPVRFG